MKPFFLWLISGVLFLSLPSMGLSETEFPHMFGWHLGMSTGAGLTYRQYTQDRFAWQVTLFPSYSGDPTGPWQGFLSLGTMEQWFVYSYTSANQPWKSSLFLWTGGSLLFLGYDFFDSRQDFAWQTFTISGGVGLEFMYNKHHVLSLAGGYSFLSTPRFDSYSATFTAEASFGYRL